MNYLGTSHNSASTIKLSIVLIVAIRYIRGTKLVVPNVGQLRARCIAMHHDPPYAGHVGRDRLKEILSRHFWWPKLHEDVADFVSKCDMCQRNKAANQKLAGLLEDLQSLQIPEGLWSSVAMYLITQLPETNNHNTAILVFVDRLSKMAILAVVKTSISAKEPMFSWTKSVVDLGFQILLSLIEILDSHQLSSKKYALG